MDISVPLVILICGMSLLLPFLVAFDTLFRFLYFHGLMASHALLVISPQESWLHEIPLIKGIAVAMAALGRLLALRAMVVAPLAHCARVIVKISGKLRGLFAPVHSFNQA
jgi:hypothetical protein